MFDFLRRGKVHDDQHLYAVVSGNVISIEEVDDEVFSQKMMGDGIAIKPMSDLVVAPAKGELSMVFPSLHAFGIKLDNGIELLIHIGLDTVNLHGKGFSQLKRVGERVEAGTPIIKMNLNYIKESGYDPVTMMIVSKSNQHVIQMTKKGYVNGGVDAIAVLMKGDQL